MKINLIQDEDALSSNPLYILRIIRYLTQDFEYVEKLMENKFDSTSEKCPLKASSGR